MTNNHNQQVLKVKLYQETAVYRNPLTMEVIETLPLPAPSTVIGFLHALMGLNEFSQKLDISIQGDYGAIYRDYQLYAKPTPEGDVKKLRNQFPTLTVSANTGLNSLQWERMQRYTCNVEKTTYKFTKPYPIVVNVLHNINLIVHINGAEEVLKRLYHLLTNPPFYPHLGRAEDLVKIESVKMINVSEIQKDWFPISLPTYIRKENVSNFGLRGILFSLPTYFKFKQILAPVIFKRKSKKQPTGKLVRDFLWQDYIYVENDFIEVDDGVNITIDEEGCPVWWLMPKPHPLERNW